MIFWLLLILFLVVLFIGAGYLLHYIIHKSGFPKAARIAIMVYTFFVLFVGLRIYYDDYFFSKEEAVYLIKEQNLYLKDDFQILKNESSSAIGDYYHSFILKITPSDKARIVSEIKNSHNFQNNMTYINEAIYLTQDHYHGQKITQNYETPYCYVRAYFEPSGREGIAPTFSRISISKSKNKLTFEDIVE